MPFRFVVAASLAVFLTASQSVTAQVLMQRDVSLRMALTIAETALAQCGIMTSVAVVDRAGRLRVFLQGDGAAPHNIELARRKAYTARTFRRTSADWAQRTETTNSRAADADRRHPAPGRRAHQCRRRNDRRRRPQRRADGRSAGRGVRQGGHRQGGGSAAADGTAILRRGLTLLDAGVVKLADAPDSKSGDRKVVGVRFPPPAPPLRFGKRGCRRRSQALDRRACGARPSGHDSPLRHQPSLSSAGEGCPP